MYVDDGYSAKDLDRPEMKRLIRDIKKGKIDVVLVYKLDRLVRSVLNLHELLQIFDKYDVKFRSATEMFDTTSAMGRFFITLVGAMAQWERENLAERVRVGMEQKALNGERNGAVAPYGYNSVDGKLVKDDDEGKILLQIFEKFKTTSLRTIAVELNNAGIKRRGKPWSYPMLQYLVQNPVYCGKLRWDHTGSGETILVDGPHEAYVSEDVFQEMQDIRTVRSKEGGKPKYGYVYTGILRCARCGSPMVGSGSPRKNGFIKAYKCTGRTTYGQCDMRIVNEKRIDEVVLKNMWDVEQFKGLFKLPSKPTGDNGSEIKKIEKELEALKNRKKRFHLAFADGAIELSELNDYLKEDKQREEELKNQLASLSTVSDSVAWSMETLTPHLERIKDTWPLIKDEQAKRQFLHSLFTSITIDVLPGKYNPEPIITQIEPR
jgi:site-specific DNA recombinase